MTSVSPRSVVRRLAGSMTAGQWQTTMLAVPLALAILVFDVPRRTTELAAPFDGRRGRATAVSPGNAAAYPAASLGPSTDRVDESVPLFADPVLERGADAHLAVDEVPEVPVVVTPPRLVALVRTGDTAVPGRRDADMADAFLAASGLTATTVRLGEPGTCQAAVDAGDVAVAGSGLDPALRGCLVDAGVIVVAYDGAGGVARTGGSGQVVSTRRALPHSLVDLAEWGAATRRLAGRIGIVGMRSAQGDIEAVLPRLQALGIDVAAKAYLPDGPPAPDISSGVLDFSRKGVTVVVFAVPVDHQRQWATKASVVSPGTRFVVSDAFDAIVEETYPASFDGSVAHTSIRVPWFARQHGRTEAQGRCDATWQARSGAPALNVQESVRMYQWCVNTALVAAAMQSSAEAGMPFAAAAGGVRLPSPLTSDLGPLADGTYGPSQDAALVWRSSCRCWQELEPFRGRGGRDVG